VLRLDGVRTVAGIRESIAAAGIAVPEPAGFADQMRRLYAALNGINRILVRRAG
jgi:hypothetical protein